jgi:predicted alpha/beta-hydrolase family hydrolase
MTDFLIDGPTDATWTYVFAHGAGGPMRAPFMSAIARGLAASGIRVVRFEFPYMAAKRRVPDREPVLLASWRQVVDELGDPRRMVIGGKSLGGRIATMVADERKVAGLLCFGYPFHPPGNPTRLRTAHLKTLATPACIVQGTRDPFGNDSEVPTYGLPPSIRIEWIPGGDHSLKSRGAGAERENMERAVAAGVTFITSL